VYIKLNEKDKLEIEIKDDYCIICILQFNEIDRRSQYSKNSLKKFIETNSGDYINICEDCWNAIRKTGIFKKMKGQRFSTTKPIASILIARGKTKSYSTPLKQSD